MNTTYFGESREPAKAEADLIKQLVETCPGAVFGELNRRLDAHGYFLAVGLASGPGAPVAFGGGAGAILQAQGRGHATGGGEVSEELMHGARLGFLWG